jgi:aldose 1-epimerase
LDKGNAFSRGLDNTFLTSRPQPWSKEHTPVASLESDESGIRLDLFTDQEALQVVTWNEASGTSSLARF